RMPTRRRVIRIRRGRITTRPRVRAISEARMRISTLLTMISRPVATGLPMTGALWRVSDRVATGPPCPQCATRVQRRGCEQRRSVIRRPRFVIVARRVVMSSPVCTISKTTGMRAGRTSRCGPSAIGHGRLPIGPRQPTTGPGQPPTGPGQPPTAKDAARQRAEALRHRMESADDLRFATTDELTGAWTRRFGLEEVSRELERAHRTGASLVLAFIDVDGLKQVNDTQGHLAGDTLLRLVGETLRANVRPYDVIVRYGGDELLCAMPNLSAPDARARFEKIAAVLTAADAKHSVTFGLAEAEPA